MIAYQSIGSNGRLGNQLFQIASTIGIAIDNEQKFAFNNFEIFNYLPNLQPFLIDDFSEFDISYTDNEFCYKDLRFPKDKNTILFGYFQSHKYFEKHPIIIEQLMKIENNLFSNYLNQYLNTNTCSIHIRRGDYVFLNKNHPLNPHPLVKLDYYNKAIELINADKYIIFSDDIVWCKEVFKGNEFIFYDHNENKKNNLQYDLFELQVMSSLNHNIIANSSYSWWAAYLNKNIDKKIIAPKIWFSEAFSNQMSKHNILNSLIPSDWTLI